MSTPTLILGNNKWAIEEDSILGYAVEDRNGSYLPREIPFTRGSDATFTTSTGVIRQACWNLLQYSEQFDNAIWGKSNITLTANSTTAPDGNIVADTIASTSSNAFVYQTFSATAATTYTFSVWVKAVSVNTSLELNLYTGGGASSVGAIIFTATDTWQRVSVTGTYSSASATAWATIGGNASFSTGESIYVWGAQLVQGSDALGYLRTTDRLNMPRVDSSTGTKTFLLEPQRTNLFLSSQQFTSASWLTGGGGSAVLTDNFATSPDGTTNAARWTAAGTNYQTRQNVATINTTATLSVWMRSNSGTKSVTLFINDYVVTSTISVTTTWQRFSVTGAVGATLSGSGRCGFSNNSILTNTDYIEVFGAQYEVGAYPTTYIPTQATTVTRIADSFSRNNIYTNGYIGQTGGTWLVELRNNVSLLRDTFTLTPLIIGDGATSPNNGLMLRNSGGTSMRLEVRKLIAGSTSLLYTTTTDIVKIAFKWNGSSVDVFVNGAKEVSASFFATTNMEFLVGNGTDAPKYIQQMKLYSEPLSDAECIEITTL